MVGIPVTYTMAAARAAGTVVAVTKLAAAMPADQSTCPTGIPALALDCLPAELRIKGIDTAIDRGVLCRILASHMGYVTCSRELE